MNISSYLLECFPAFKHRNYRLYWSGQAVSFIGAWMQNAALSWLVYDLVQDRLKLGFMTAVQYTPLLLFSLPFGVIIEMFPKRKIIILTQTLQLLAALFLFVMVYLNFINYGYILLIMFFVGTVQAVDNPARQSFVIELVEGRGDLLNAIALNSAAFNSARLIGPALAGKMMALLGAKWCFFINGISFGAVLLGLMMMKFEGNKIENEFHGNIKENMVHTFREMFEGIKYIFNTPKLIYTLLSVAVVSTFCINFNVLMPIFTKDVLMLKEKAYGTLLSALGLGALISAITVAINSKRGNPYKLLMTGSLGLSIFLIIMGISKNYFLALVILAFCGFFMIRYSTTANSMMQLNSPDNMRGRIMSAYSLVMGGLIPFGSTYAGTVSKYFGVEMTFVISGFIGLIGFSIIFLKRRELA